MSSYTSFRDTEFRLYGEIVQLRSIANALSLQETSSLADLEASVVGHRFRVAVVGEFNRGKSTAINALLGAEVLPASIEACSAALNRVTFGTHIGARVVMRGEGPLEQRSEAVPLDELVAYVTKLSPDAARMASTIEEAIITYPSHFCRNNVDLIDTPGLNDEPTMTNVTMRAIGHINAAIIVIRAAFSFSQSEQLLFEKLLSRDVTSILFLVTAIDELEESDRPRIIRETHNRILKTLHQYADDVYEQGTPEYNLFLKDFGSPQIYGVAALNALDARRTGNTEQEQASGYPAFEAGLEQLLAARDGSLIVEQTGRRLLKVCEQIDRAITERCERVADEDAKFGQTETKILHILQHVQNEIDIFARQARHDAEDILFHLRQKIQQHEELLKSAINKVILTLPIEARDIVACAGQLWSDPRRPAQINPSMRAWAVSVAQTTDSSGITIIEQLGTQLQQELNTAWQELLSMMVQHIYTSITTLHEQSVNQSKRWVDQFNEVVAKSEVRTSTTFPSITAWLNTHVAASEHERSTLIEHLINTPPTLQVQPLMVALRAVTGVISTATTQINPDEFLNEFRVLCQRAVSGGLDMQRTQCADKLSELTYHAARIMALITNFLSSLIEPVLSMQQDVIAHFARERSQREAHSAIELQQLDQYGRHVITIVRTTTQILQELEHIDGKA